MITKITKINFILLLFITIYSNAQTITYGNFSKSLTESLHAVLVNQASFNMALTTTIGNGVTWDASGLTQQSSTPIINMIYAAPSATPYAALYTTSNYTRYDPALTSVVAYDYFNFSADSIVKFGGYEPSTSHEIYTNPDKLMQFPLAFGQTFTDNYAKTNYSNATTISSYQTGKRTVAYVGFGTLKLPQGIFNNVALIAEVRTNSLGPDSPTFTWYDITNGRQLLMYHENAGKVTLAYSNDLPTSINELKTNASNFTIYPNPAQNFITIQSTEKIVSATIFNIQGKEQLSTNLNSIDVSALATGIYFINVKTQEGNSIQKFIVE